MCCWYWLSTRWSKNGYSHICSTRSTANTQSSELQCVIWDGAQRLPPWARCSLQEWQKLKGRICHIVKWLNNQTTERIRKANRSCIPKRWAWMGGLHFRPRVVMFATKKISMFLSKSENHQAVFAIITPDMLRAIQKIRKIRTRLGLDDNNDYVFACRGEKKTHFRGSKAFQEIWDGLQLANITAGKIR